MSSLVSEESKPEDFFFWGGGVEGGGGRRGIPTENKSKKNKRYSLIFCAHALYKILSSWLKWFSSFNTNKRSNGQVRGHNSANVLRNSVKSHLNMDPKQSSEFQDPSASDSLHIVLTRLSFLKKLSLKRGITRSIFYRVRSKVYQVI